MPRAKRSIESAVTIDGFPLVWHLHREQQLSTADGWKGLAIHVKVAEGTRRELQLEYPTVNAERTASPRMARSTRPTILKAKVEAQIREAMEAGWDPNSRGKPFFYQAAELPS
jgi:hypothetical protein